MSLRERLAAQIAAAGPMPVSRYMDLCLNDPDHGYYATRPALGEAGDFITAPLVSQMFGELIGLWAAEVWAAIGRPARLRLVEMGPGLGVMMADMLRAARAAPGFLDAAEVWLVETSAPLRARQAAALAGRAAPRWIGRLEDLPRDLPVILIANELIDCLPIDQAVLGADGWRERRVGLGADGALAFVAGDRVAPPPWSADAPPGAVAESSEAVRALGGAVGALVAEAGGAALFIDYGRDAPGPGDTLQALRGHARQSPLESPGEADLTAHADFPAFLAAARGAGARVSAVRGQGAFLFDLGLGARAAALARANPDRTGLLTRQMERLAAPEQMGTLFKAAAVASAGLNPPALEMQP